MHSRQIAFSENAHCLDYRFQSVLLTSVEDGGCDSEENSGLSHGQVNGTAGE